MSFARDGRCALCSLVGETGPAAPTLCKGWATLDLAAHLVLREHRMDAGAGILGGPLARYTRAVQRQLPGRPPPPRPVWAPRDGPPGLSGFGIPGQAARADGV